jgi:hypothetical protein
MQPEPVAQIVFAVSAVEMLGQHQDWSTEQKLILEDAALASENSPLGTIDERLEVAAAIRRGAHKVGLRQGVIRLLKSLGLEHLKRQWDVIYSARSALFHGLTPQPGVDYSQLAYRVISLCGRILLTAAAQEVAGIDQHLDKFYEMK